MTKYKQNISNEKNDRKNNQTFTVGAASTIIVVIAYFVTSVLGNDNVIGNLQVGTISLLVAFGSVIAAGICVASFVSKQQRALSVLCFVICLTVTVLAYFAYWFSGYGSSY